jgi:hypothetical protein
MAAEFAGAGYMQVAGAISQMMASREAGRMARVQGERARIAADFAAWQAEEQAGTAIAISQRQAMEERRQATLVASRALAVASASGAGVSDPTMVRILANARGAGTYRANVALYEGEAKARILRLDAAAGRVSGWDAQAEGADRAKGYALQSMGNTFRTGASLYAKYGGDGPSGDYKLIDRGDYGGGAFGGP